MEPLELAETGHDDEGQLTKTYKTRSYVQNLLRTTFFLSLSQLIFSGLLFILSMAKGFTSTNYQGLMGLVVLIFAMLQGSLCMALAKDETSKVRFLPQILVTVINAQVSLCGVIINGIADVERAPWLSFHNRGGGYLALAALSGLVCLGIFVAAIVQLAVLIIMSRRVKK